MDAFTLRPEVLEDWKQLLHECADDAPPDRFVYLWSLDAPQSAAERDAVLMGTDALLHLIQAIDEIKYSTRLAHRFGDPRSAATGARYECGRRCTSTSRRIVCASS